MNIFSQRAIEFVTASLAIAGVSTSAFAAAPQFLKCETSYSGFSGPPKLKSVPIEPSERFTIITRSETYARYDAQKRLLTVAVGSDYGHSREAQVEPGERVSTFLSRVIPVPVGCEPSAYNQCVPQDLSFKWSCYVE